MKKLKAIILISILSLVLLIKSNTSAVVCDGGWEASTQEQCDLGNGKGAEVIGNKCMGIKLNTNFPFIGNCIKTYTYDKKDPNEATPVNAFPKLIGALMNLLMTVILIMSLLTIVYSGVLMTMDGADQGKYKEGIHLLTQVAKGMALLGASGVILKIINPNFFV